MITRLTNQKSQILSIASQHDTMQASDTEDKTERVYANMRFFRGDEQMEIRQSNIAATILASKGKSMSNLGEDIIIEKRANSDNGLSI